MNDTPQTSEEAPPSNVEQLRSPAYTLAALDQGFL
ncbi:3-isopropylmalate dehydrogenase, partial [Herbaspirillum sp. HC18]